MPAPLPVYQIFGNRLRSDNTGYRISTKGLFPRLYQTDLIYSTRNGTTSSKSASNSNKTRRRQKRNPANSMTRSAPTRYPCTKGKQETAKSRLQVRDARVRSGHDARIRHAEGIHASGEAGSEDEARVRRGGGAAGALDEPGEVLADIFVDGGHADEALA